MSTAAFLILSFAFAQIDAPKPSVFELPRIQAQFNAYQQRITALFAEKKYEEAETLLGEAIKLIPNDSSGYYNLACAQARQGKKDEALKSLAQAVEAGFNDTANMMADEDLATLRDSEQYKSLLEKAANAKPMPWKFTATPSEVVERVATVSEANTGFDSGVGAFSVQFKLPAKPASEEVVKGFGEAGNLVRKWYSEGTAAGNHGDFYDNHDTDHSNMDYDSFPQLTRVEFDEAAQKQGLHHGLQLLFFYNKNAPTIGNSSTALVHGVFWRSQVRNALTQPRGPQLLYLQYASNHMYFYPEHRDHDPGHNGSGDGYGDVVPANTPSYFLSQGSSGSDRPLMHAVALILAAFRPEVKAELVRQNALAPTVQMIFRQGYTLVEKPEDYLTGKAHPTAFDGDKLDAAKMVTMAHEITRDSLPPIVQIHVIKEDEPVVGVDYFDIAPREKFFDTPAAIARIAKSTKFERTMLVSAERSRDLTGKELKYHWVVLRGDPERIKIDPIAAGQAAEIKLQYQSRRPVVEGSALESNRVDIGCFVENDKYYSAPAFISTLYLDNDKREYDVQCRILTVDYADPEVSRNYVDPLLEFKKDWRDDYEYDAAGRLVGWTRTRGEKKERFTRDGCLVIKSDELGRPTEAKVVQYEAKQGRGEAPSLHQVASERTVRYEYESNDDRAGKRNAQ